MFVCEKMDVIAAREDLVTPLYVASSFCLLLMLVYFGFDGRLASHRKIVRATDAEAREQVSIGQLERRACLQLVSLHHIAI